jgi:hypothetical protein
MFSVRQFIALATLLANDCQPWHKRESLVTCYDLVYHVAPYNVLGL